MCRQNMPPDEAIDLTPEPETDLHDLPAHWEENHRSCPSETVANNIAKVIVVKIYHS